MNPLLSAQSFQPDHVSPPLSWVGHTPFAAAVIHALRPRIFVELGTHTGNSYFAFCQAVKESDLPTRCHAIDTWVGDEFAGHYGDSVFQDVCRKNSDCFEDFSALKRSTFEAALGEFLDASIDLLHIDGSHRYEDVKTDFEDWFPKVREGGIILIHDIHCRNEGFGVWKFWKELEQEHPLTFSFSHSFGLGVLVKGNSPPEDPFLYELLCSESPEYWHGLFQHLGRLIEAPLQAQSAHAQLFIRDEKGFSEARSVRQIYVTGKSATIEFSGLEALAPKPLPLHLRFDPIDQKGFIQIEEIECVLASEDGELSVIRPSYTIPESGDLIRTGLQDQHLSIGKDPQIFLNLNQSDPEQSPFTLSSLRVKLLVQTNPQDLIHKFERALQSQAVKAQPLASTVQEELARMKQKARNSRAQTVPRHQYHVEMTEVPYFSKASRKVTINGWFFDHLGHSAKRIRVRAQGKKFEARKTPRPDVFEHFSEEGFIDEWLGFSAQVELDPGFRFIAVEALNRDGDWITLKSPWSRLKEAPFNRPTCSDLEIGVLIADRLENKEAAKPVDHFKPQPVAVIIPVYRDVEMTRQCIQRAMHSIEKFSDKVLIAINDCSPEAGMTAMLQGCKEKWPRHFRLIENPKNLGFVKSVNLGISAASRWDVILLNSDAFVANDGLLRLQREAYRYANTATVTPLTNDGTICSFPKINYQNPSFLGLGIEEIDSMASELNLDPVDAPTGVGFCMYIRSSSIRKVGLFDEARFPRGYGEENDFCQRAKKSGFRNLITPNVYVQHLGSRSFGEAKPALLADATKAMNELHPAYSNQAVRYIKTDPLRHARSALAFTAAARFFDVKILNVTHALGGGTQQHIEELTDELGDRAYFVNLAPAPTVGPQKISISIGNIGMDLQLQFHAEEEYAEIIRLLNAIGFRFIHYHNLYEMPEKMTRLHNALALPYKITVHDSQWIGWHPSSEHFEGAIEERTFEATRVSQAEQARIRTEYRQKNGAFIAGAKQLIFPSEDVKARFTEVFPETPQSAIVPHLESKRAINTPITLREREPGSAYRIAAVAATTRQKGADRLEALAQYNAHNGSPFEFILLGQANRELEYVESTGPYSNDQLVDIISLQRVDIIIFLSIAPETYCYALSQTLEAGLPIFAPKLGAFIERLQARPMTQLFEHSASIAQIHASLIEFTQKLEAPDKAESTKALPSKNPNEISTRFYTTEYFK